MTAPRNSRFAPAPGPFRRSRRVGVSLLLALCVAVAPVAAHGAWSTTKPVVKASFSTTDSPARLPDVTRTGGIAQFFVGSTSTRQRHTGLDALAFVSLVAVFGAFRRRANLQSGGRFRFDASYALRRGPPYLHTAH